MQKIESTSYQNSFEKPHCFDIVQSLSKLPEPWKTRSIKNHLIQFERMNQDNKNNFLKRYVGTKDIRSAINSFAWCSTVEGNEYWSMLFHSII